MRVIFKKDAIEAQFFMKKQSMMIYKKQHWRENLINMSTIATDNKTYGHAGTSGFRKLMKNGFVR